MTPYKKNYLFLNIAILWLGHFLVDFMIGIWPVYKTMAHLDLAKAGLIGGVCALAGEGLQIIFGTLSDRGYQKLLISGGLIATLTSILFVFTQDYLLVFGLYLMTCTGSGAFHPTAASLMGDLSSQKKGLYISIFASGGALGLALSQIIFTQAHSFSNGNVLWLGIPTFGLALFAYLFYSYVSPLKAAAVGKKFDLKLFGKFFRNRELFLLYCSQLCNATLMWGTMFLLPDVLYTRQYESWITFGGGHLMLILGGAVMMVPAGYLADKYSTKKVIFTATALSLILFYFFLFNPALRSMVVMVLLFLLGATLGIVNPVSVAFGTRLAPQHKGMVSAFLMGMVWCVSEGIGQCGGGLLTKCYTHDAPAMALATIGSLFFVNLIIIAKLSSDRKETERPAVESQDFLEMELENA